MGETISVPASGAGEDDESIPQDPPALPECLSGSHEVTCSGGLEGRRRIGEQLLGQCRKPDAGKVVLGQGSNGAVFRVGLARSTHSDSSTADSSTQQLQQLAIKVVFNYGLRSSEAQTNCARKEFEVLTQLPVHRNLVRLIFEHVDRPPLWMVQMLREPSLVCHPPPVDAETGAEQVGSRLLPRKAQLLGIELLPSTLADKMAHLEHDTGGPLSNDTMVLWALDVAEGVHHLLQHGVVHRDLKLDNVMWDSRGGPEGVGRAVIIDLGCSLRVSSGAAAGGGGASAGTPSLAGPMGETEACRALDRQRYAELQYRGDSVGGNPGHLAPEVQDAWYKGAVQHEDVTVPFGKQASWALGVLMFELAAAEHPFGEGFPASLPDGSEVRPGNMQDILGSYDGPFSRRDLFERRPEWYCTVVKGLLQADPSSRLTVGDAVGRMRSAARPLIRELQAKAVARGLLTGGPTCADAVKQIWATVDEFERKAFTVGTMRVVWYVWATCIAAPESDLCDGSQALLDHIQLALIKLAQRQVSLGPLADMLAGNDAEMAACCMWRMLEAPSLAVVAVVVDAVPSLLDLLRSKKGLQAEFAARALRSLCGCSREGVHAIVSGGGIAGLQDLLPSRRGQEAEQSLGVLCSLSCASQAYRDVIVSSGSLPCLVGLLGSPKGMESEMAVGVLFNLCNHTRASADAVVSAGGAPRLISMLGSVKGREAELAVAVLGLLCGGSPACKDAVLSHRGVPGLMRLLGSRKGREAEQAAGALRDFCGGSHACRDAVLSAGCIPSLVNLLESTKGQEAVQAAGALANLCFTSQACRDAVVSGGGIPGFLGLLKSGKGEETYLSAGALRNLCYESQASRDAVVSAGGIEILVNLLQSSNGQVVEQAAAVLFNVCQGSQECKDAVVEAGSVPRLVGMLRSEEGQVAEQAAAVLFKLCTGPLRTVRTVVECNAIEGLVHMAEARGRKASVAVALLSTLLHSGGESLPLCCAWLDGHGGRAPVLKAIASAAAAGVEGASALLEQLHASGW